MNKITHKVRSYAQRPGSSECAVCAIASVANFEYPTRPADVRAVLPQRMYKDGMYSGTQALALNRLGYAVKVYSSNPTVVDFRWNRLELDEVTERLALAADYHPLNGDIQEMYNWLSESYLPNRLLATGDMMAAIKYEIKRGKPAVYGVNCELMHSMTKRINDTITANSDYKGEVLEHAIVIYGCSDRFVYISDPEGGVKRRLSWGKLLTSSPNSELIVIR